MDVDGVIKNTINLNENSSYWTNSQYTSVDREAVIPQIQKIGDESSVENKEYTKKDLDSALKKINNFLKEEHAHAEYSIHKDFKTIMIKIVDEDTKQVILEVPPKKILDMVAFLCKQAGILDKKA